MTLYFFVKKIIDIETVRKPRNISTSVMDQTSYVVTRHEVKFIQHFMALTLSVPLTWTITSHLPPLVGPPFLICWVSGHSIALSIMGITVPPTETSHSAMPMRLPKRRCASLYVSSVHHAGSGTRPP